MISIRSSAVVAGLFVAMLSFPAVSIAQEVLKDHRPAVDSDGDGLSDVLEQTLLEKFAPKFYIGPHDCSNVPAEFETGLATPTVEREDGTIYGQAFFSKLSTKDSPVAELHFYHLWRVDCGEHGHPLDTEHVAVLVRGSNEDLTSAHWEALYWYAAAHENTVCDVSQIARASTLGAVDHGAKVWISPDKHASYLSETLCKRGCGADRCEAMMPLAVSRIVNLGEAGKPMNGSAFITSGAWPLAGKMIATNFPAAPIARLNILPDTDIAWFNAGRHPAQQIISISASTESAIADSGLRRLIWPKTQPAMPCRRAIVRQSTRWGCRRVASARRCTLPPNQVRRSLNFVATTSPAGPQCRGSRAREPSHAAPPPPLPTVAPGAPDRSRSIRGGGGRSY